MALRDVLNKNPALATGLAVVIIVAAAALMFWSLSGGGGVGGAGLDAGTPQRFYTADDGKTWFADDYNRIPPYDKDGKQAVIAKVFRDLDNPNEPPFVAYLQRYTPEGKKMMEDRLKSAGQGGLAPMEGLAPPTEYKKPGEANWMRSNDPRAITLINDLRSPKGSANVEEVFPG